MPQEKDMTAQESAQATGNVGAVMVVGGGVAGMQASLDLANAGFYVHMVETKPAIGGVMAQLDKTFPTNDCSMCIISPKLVECGRHLNIEIHTLTDVAEIAGEPGNFRVTLKKQPRYIDQAKCTGCGECTNVCPVTMSDTFNENLAEWKATYRLYPQAIPSTFAIKKFDRAPCVRACPANLSAQGYVQLIKAGKYNESVKPHHGPPAPARGHRPYLPPSLRERLPPPGDGRARGHLLPEAVCRGPGGLGRLAGAGRAPKNRPVAIVGAGPAGLSCAYHLALKGYQAVIFEAAPEAGGWLRYGIPEYRLPREVLKREVDYVQRLGVKIHYNSPIGAGRTINDLLTRDGFNAVFLGVGTQDSIRLPVPGAEAAGVLWGVEYLKEVNSTGVSPTQGKRVVVIGGGNVAMDVARVARRQGAAAVTLVALESAEELPASPWEVEEARVEGIEIVHRWGVKQILSQNG